MKSIVKGVWWVVLAFGLFQLVGCASKPTIDWGARIGVYSYDDAVRELGPPEKSAKLTDGSTVGDWLTGRGMQTTTAYGPAWYGYGYRRYGYGYGYGWGGPHMVMTSPAPNYYLRLTFDPQGMLASWQKLVI